MTNILPTIVHLKVFGKLDITKFTPMMAAEDDTTDKQESDFCAAAMTQPFYETMSVITTETHGPSGCEEAHNQPARMICSSDDDSAPSSCDACKAVLKLWPMCDVTSGAMMGNPMVPAPPPCVANSPLELRSHGIQPR